MWSWGLAALGFIGLYFTWEIGNGRRWPWAAMSVSGLPWFVYSITTRQWGFLLSSGLALAINLRNWRHH